MRHVINNLVWAAGYQRLAFMNLTNWIMLACKLVEVIAKSAAILPILKLSDESVYV